jgi:hypothetical protein
VPYEVKLHGTIKFANGGIVSNEITAEVVDKHPNKGMINDDVQAFVILLGAMEPEQIWSWLWKRGHLGIPSDGWDCPIAHAILAETGQHVVVGRNVISGSNCKIDIPPTITAFIELYDRGRYPDLISYRRAHRGIFV